jgi:hypothetical protein
MHTQAVGGISLAEFQSQYESYPLKRGLSRPTIKLYQQVLRSFFLWRFPATGIQLRDLRFNDFVRFLTREFERLHHRESQRVWLMVLRSLLRFLAQEAHIPEGWDHALPAIGNYQHAHLPRRLSPEQVRSLFKGTAGNKARNLRDRALLLLFLRLHVERSVRIHPWRDQRKVDARMSHAVAEARGVPYQMRNPLRRREAKFFFRLHFESGVPGIDIAHCRPEFRGGVRVRHHFLTQCSFPTGVRISELAV